MSTMNFTGLNVLLCRPQDAATTLQERIIEAGGSCSHVPCMEIVTLAEIAEIAEIKNRILDVDRYQKVIFISQNAVKHAEPWLDQYWPQLPIDQQYFAIGAATAEAVSNMAFVELHKPCGAMDTESLLELPQLQDLSDKNVLIFRGKGGRELLAQALRQRGATVDYCELYRRQAPQGLAQSLSRSVFANTGLRHVIMVHSGESLANLHGALKEVALDDWLEYELICPSQRVANQAHDLGFGKVRAASNAGEPAMLKALTLVSNK